LYRYYQMKHTNVLCEQNAEFCNIKVGGKYSNHSAVHTVKEAKSQRPSVDILPPHIHYVGTVSFLDAQP
jgi:hypothetical protein